MEVSLLSHLTNSAIVVYLIQYLKGTHWYAKLVHDLPIADSHVHVWASALGAFATAIGMHGAVSGSQISGWQITLAIPPLWVLLHSIWDVAQQMVLNQLIFALAVQQKEAAPVITAKLSPNVSVTTGVEGLKETPAVVGRVAS